MIIEAVGTVFKRKQETNPDTRYLIEKTDIRFFWGTFIVHSYSMLSCYLYWHVSSAGCSFVLCCVNVLTHAKTFYHFIINNTGIDMLGSYYIFTFIWKKRIVLWYYCYITSYTVLGRILKIIVNQWHILLWYQFHIEYLNIVLTVISD